VERANKMIATTMSARNASGIDKMINTQGESIISELSTIASPPGVNV